MTVQLINLRELQRRLPRSRSTVYMEISNGTFPRPLKAGRSSFWREDELDDLIAAYARGVSQEGLRALCMTFYERRVSGSRGSGNVAHHQN